jgi:hypothetical protein
MKNIKIEITILCVFLTFNASAQSLKKEDLLGNWIAMVDRDTLAFNFQKNGKLSVTDNGVQNSLNYNLDTIASENILIVITARADSSENLYIYFKIKIPSENQLYLLAYREKGKDPNTQELFDKNDIDIKPIIFIRQRDKQLQ